MLHINQMTMNIDELRNAFNNRLVEFVDDLAETFPSFGDFNTMKTVLKIACAVTPSVPNNIFHKTAIRYESQIMNKDDKFLLDETYDSEHIDMDIADKIKHIWKHTDADNKAVIWQYLLILVKLDKMINAS
jgi:hypothetical protein